LIGRRGLTPLLALKRLIVFVKESSANMVDCYERVEIKCVSILCLQRIFCRTCGSAPPSWVVGLRPTFQLHRVGVEPHYYNYGVVGIFSTLPSRM
jgi:hypothetical protein